MANFPGRIRSRYSGPDSAQKDAVQKLSGFFDERREGVFYSRQIEVQNEGEFFHWITNRALRELVETKLLYFEERKLRTGGVIHLLWHNSYRYYKRSARKIVSLVEEYADQSVGVAIGLNAEMIVSNGFARSRFLMEGDHTRVYNGTEWIRSNHDLDFIFSKDSVVYGVEVKNQLGYMNHDELRIKIAMCRALEIRPVFVVRMMPAGWINELWKAGGFALILKYQLYPLPLKNLAKRMREELGLPADAPKALEDGTMQRFLNWHYKHVK